MATNDEFDPSTVAEETDLVLKRPQSHWTSRYVSRMAENVESELIQGLAGTSVDDEQEEPIAAPVSRMGQSPRFSRNPDELRSVHLLSSRYLMTSLTFVVSPHIEASRTPLKDLTRTALRELVLEVTFRGGYVPLRTLEPAYSDGAIKTIVEDHEGTTAKFHLYNYTTNLNLDVTDFLPLGTVFLLKEPFCSENIEGDCILHCENISDMIVVDEGHELDTFTEGIVWKNHIFDPLLRYPLPITASNWKERGHSMLMSGKRQLAVRCFFLALKKIDSENDKEGCLRALYAKFGVVYLGLGFFEAALKWAEKLLESEPENPTGLVVAGKACYPLRRHEEALEYFEEFFRIFQGSVKSISDLLIRCNARIVEREKGVYIMYDMFSKEIANPRDFIDCSDYVGPIRVITVEGEGRGVVATRQLVPGTLLVVSKALAFSWHPVLSQNRNQHGKPVCCEELMVLLAQKMSRNPRTFGPMIYSLYDGINPVTEVPSGWFCDPETEMESIVDMLKLNGIVTNNMLGDGTSASKTGFGIFQWPSYFNHSCMPNASYLKFNDIVFIRAIQYIDEGEEVYLPCLSSDVLLTSKVKLCAKRGLKCGCLLCRQQEELPESIREKRQFLLDVYDGMYEMISKGRVRDLPKLIRDIHQLTIEVKEAYSGTEPFQLKMVLASTYALLAKAYAMSSNDEPTQPLKEIECHKLILRLYGFDLKAMARYHETGADLIPPHAVLNENVLTAVSRLIILYLFTNQTSLKDRWIHVILALEKIYSGGTKSVAKLRYQSIRSLFSTDT